MYCRCQSFGENTGLITTVTLEVDTITIPLKVKGLMWSHHKGRWVAMVSQ